MSNNNKYDQPSCDCNNNQNNNQNNYLPPKMYFLNN